MNFQYKITVFTPTFNRAYIIENLYRSLQRQTYSDFEWLIIDDGSVDNTEEVFKGWLEETNAFPIRYYKQPNGGKCRAINRALDFAEGELFFTVDSDDYLTEDALEKIATWEKRLPKTEKYCGIAGNLGTSPNQTPNTIFNGEFYDGNLLDRYRNVDGERAIVIYTEVHRKYKYPTFDDESFMTEAVVWNRIAHDGYKMRFYNDIIWIYEYKEDGLTKAGSKLFLNNPRGYGLWLREKATFEGISWIDRLKMNYTFACDLSGLFKPKVIAESIGTYPIIVSMIGVIHRVLRKIHQLEIK